MSGVSFTLKKQRYLNLLDALKNALTSNNLVEALSLATEALDVCNELLNMTTIPELNAQFINDNKKLNNMIEIIKSGKNPITPKGEPSRAANAEPNKKDGQEEASTFFSKEYPKTKLEDVYGLEEVKEEIRLKVIEPIKDLEFYLKYNDEVGCQILLYGPPGCGKSFVAEAIAGELKCSYAFLNAADILDKYVGEAPKKIKQIFAEAEKYDNCLIFFDELDSLFASRESDESSHTKDVLTVLLTCLSGFKSNNKDCIRVVIGATNRPWALDSALLRGKRFDTQIYIGLPDYDARMFLIKKAFKHNNAIIENSDVDINELCNRFDGYSCADISSMMAKIKQLAYKKSLANNKVEVPISQEDVDEVFANYRNSINENDLVLFENYKKGLI